MGSGKDICTAQEQCYGYFALTFSETTNIVNKRLAQSLRIVLTTILVLALLYYLGRFFAHNWEDLQSFSWKVNCFYMAVAILLGVASIIASGLNWKFILDKLYKVHLSSFNAVRMHSLSLLGRYIPGKIWMFAGKVYLCSIMNVSKAKSGASVLIEFVFFNMISIYLFAFAYISNMEITLMTKFILFLLTATLVIIIPQILIFFNRQIMKITIKEPVLEKFNYLDMLVAQNRYFISWFFVGTGLFFLIKSIYPVESELYFVIVAYFAISCTIGMLSFLIPGGLGVRESFMVFFFKDILPIEIVMITVVLSRLWLTVLEVLLAFGTQASYFLGGRKFQKQPLPLDK